MKDDEIHCSMGKFHRYTAAVLVGAYWLLGALCLSAEEIRFRSPSGEKWISVTANEQGKTLTYREEGQEKGALGPQVLWKTEYKYGRQADCDVSWSTGGVHFALTEHRLTEDEVTFYACHQGKAEKVLSFPDATTSSQIQKHVEKLVSTKRLGVSGAKIEDSHLKVMWLDHQKIKILVSISFDMSSGGGGTFDFEYTLDLDTKKGDLRDSGVRISW